MEYFDEKDAQDAVREFDRYVLDGNELSVIIAQDRRKSVSEHGLYGAACFALPLLARSHPFSLSLRMCISD